MTVRIPFDDAQDTDLVDLLDRDVLERHAGWLVYMRGVDHAAQGHVTDVELSDTRSGSWHPPLRRVSAARHIGAGLLVLLSHG